MRKRMDVLVLLALFALSACAGGRKMTRTFSGEAGEIVISQGIAPIMEGNTIDARKSALADAQKNAVEKVVGVYVSATTRVEKAITIESEIVARTQGYIDSYDILEEGKDEEFYKIKIKAVVKLDDISRDLKDLGLLMTPGSIKNPKVAVLIDETLEGKEQLPSESESAIIAELINKGYTVIESSDLSEEELEGIASGKQRYYSSLAERLKVEVLILGQSESSFFTDKNLGGFVSYRATLQARVLKAQTGEILMSVSKQASGVDVVKNAAGKKALREVGKLVGSELAGAIAGKLKTYSMVEVSIAGIGTVNKLDELMTYLRGVSYVRNIAINKYSKETTSLSVKLGSGNTSKLSTALEKFTGAQLKVLSLSSYQIFCEIK